MKSEKLTVYDHNSMVIQWQLDCKGSELSLSARSARCQALQLSHVVQLGVEFIKSCQGENWVKNMVASFDDREGVSYRVIAYYEGETDYPPAHLIEPLARALNISTDELPGVRDTKQERDPQQAALWRRLKKIEDLPKADQKALLHYLDALVKKNQGATA